MEEYISFDSHKRYTLMEREKKGTGKREQRRIEHRAGAIREGLEGIAKGTAVAVEATGNWSWIVNEIEEAGMVPRLVHPRKAKLMMGMVNKTDKLDVHGLNLLQRNGTLPTVWIPPASLRDLRELTRGRMAIAAERHQSLPALGLRRGRQCRFHPSSATSGPSRQPTLSAAAFAQRARQGDRRSRAPPGRSSLACPESKGTVSGPGFEKRCRQRSASAKTP